MRRIILVFGTIQKKTNSYIWRLSIENGPLMNKSIRRTLCKVLVVSPISRIAGAVPDNERKTHRPPQRSRILVWHALCQRALSSHTVYTTRFVAWTTGGWSCIDAGYFHCHWKRRTSVLFRHPSESEQFSRVVEFQIVYSNTSLVALTNSRRSIQTIIIKIKSVLGKYLFSSELSLFRYLTVCFPPVFQLLNGVFGKYAN